MLMVAVVILNKH